jgi:hypothetical protein
MAPPVIEIVDRGAVTVLPEEERGRGWLDRFFAGRGRVKVDREIVIRIGRELFIIEKGFVSDGSSRPWWSSFFIDPWGRRGIPGIFHDWLLSRRLYSKRITDWLFLGLLIAEHVADLESVLMFLGGKRRPDPTFTRLM